MEELLGRQNRPHPIEGGDHLGIAPDLAGELPEFEGVGRRPPRRAVGIEEGAREEAFDLAPAGGLRARAAPDGTPRRTPGRPPHPQSPPAPAPPPRPPPP